MTLVRTTAPTNLDKPSGSITYTRFDGSTRTFTVHKVDANPRTYSSLTEALKVASERARTWQGIAVGVFQAADGAHLVEHVVSQNDRPFVIDGPTLAQIGVKQVTGSRLDAGLEALVGERSWIDLKGAGATDRRPKPLPSVGSGPKPAR